MFNAKSRSAVDGSHNERQRKNPYSHYTTKTVIDKILQEYLLSTKPIRRLHNEQKS